MMTSFNWSMLWGILVAAGATVLMGLVFLGLYWIVRDGQREAHEERHRQDNDMFQGGER